MLEGKDAMVKLTFVVRNNIVEILVFRVEIKIM